MLLLLRAGPLERGKAKITANRIRVLQTIAYRDSNRKFDFDSHEWSCPSMAQISHKPFDDVFKHHAILGLQLKLGPENPDQLSLISTITR